VAGSQSTTAFQKVAEAYAVLADPLARRQESQKRQGKTVGPLEPDLFNELSAWCRNVGLTDEGETVEAAIRASG
jgi:hypothetical protein